VAGPYKVSEGQLLDGAHPFIVGDCVWGANYIGTHETGAGAITYAKLRGAGAGPRLTLTPVFNDADMQTRSITDKLSPELNAPSKDNMKNSC
jgi:hypothetical protein